MLKAYSFSSPMKSGFSPAALLPPHGVVFAHMVKPPEPAWIKASGGLVHRMYNSVIFLGGKKGRSRVRKSETGS